MAKQSRASQGEKMLVEIHLNYPETLGLLPRFRDGGFMPKLGEEARVVMNVDGQALKTSDILDILDEFGDFFDFPM